MGVWRLTEYTNGKVFRVEDYLSKPDAQYFMIKRYKGVLKSIISGVDKNEISDLNAEIVFKNEIIYTWTIENILEQR